MAPKAKSPRVVPSWAEALKKRRTQLGLSQEEVATRSQEQLAQRTVSALETGAFQLKDLSVSRLLALSRALDWTLYQLQAHTGLDLGLGSPELQLSPAPLQSLPLYPLSEALKPPALRAPFPDFPAPVWEKDLREGLWVFFEGSHPLQGGTLHYIDTTHTRPHPEQAYLIVHQDTPRICDYKDLGPAAGKLGAFVSSDGTWMLAHTVQVIGHRVLLSHVERALHFRSHF